MASVSENLNKILEIKTDIKTAIEEQGQDLTNIPFSGYADSIKNISTLSKIDVSEYNIKLGYSDFEYVLEFFVFDNCTTMEGMFSDCGVLKGVDLTMIDWENVISTRYLFWDCQELEDLILPEPFNLGATDVDYTFSTNSQRTDNYILSLPSTINLINCEIINDRFISGRMHTKLITINAPKLKTLNYGIRFRNQPNGAGVLMFKAPNLERADNPFSESVFDMVDFEMGSRTIISEDWGFEYVRVLNINGFGVGDESSELVESQTWDFYLPYLEELEIGGDYKNFNGKILCTSDRLSRLSGFQNYRANIDISSCNNLPGEYLVYIFNALGTAFNGGSTIKISATTANDLSPNDIAIATAKGFTVSY